MAFFALQSDEFDYMSEFSSWEQKLSSAGIFRRKPNLNDPAKRVDLVEKHFQWSPSEADVLISKLQFNFFSEL